MSKRAMVYLHATSPLHVGTGQSLDVIDLPIQRERATELPVVPGSALKGVLRAECEAREAGGSDLREGFVRSAFGPQDDPSEGAGAITFGDARLLLFPVRSLRLLFAWVTSPYLVRRYARDRAALGLPSIGEDTSLEAAIRATSAAVVGSKDLLLEGRVFLEDADLTATVAEPVTALAERLGQLMLPPPWRPLLRDRLVIVSDTQMSIFARQCTEIVARVTLKDEEKTVRDGGLWYEESLPAEAVLYANVLFESTRGNKSRRFDADAHARGLRAIESAQLGGKASVGRGLCKLSWEASA